MDLAAVCWFVNATNPNSKPKIFIFTLFLLTIMPTGARVTFPHITFLGAKTGVNITVPSQTGLPSLPENGSVD